MPIRPRVLKTKLLVPRHEPQPILYGKGRGGRPWRRLRDEVLERDGHLCQCTVCKQRSIPCVAHEVDHIVPVAEGGTDDPGNLQAINRDCHKGKTQREAARGRARAGRPRNPDL